MGVKAGSGGGCRVCRSILASDCYGMGLQGFGFGYWLSLGAGVVGCGHGRGIWVGLFFVWDGMAVAGFFWWHCYSCMAFRDFLDIS